MLKSVTPSQAGCDVMRRAKRRGPSYVGVYSDSLREWVTIRGRLPPRYQMPPAEAGGTLLTMYQPPTDQSRLCAEIAACPCAGCREMSVILARCRDRNEWLYVTDCRVLGHRWQVVDARRLGRGPAHVGPGYGSLREAAEAVLREQRHCDAFVSSWPVQLLTLRDYRWSRKQIV